MESTQKPPPLQKKNNFLTVLVYISLNEKLEITRGNIVLVMFWIKNFVKQQLFCSTVNNINKYT